MSACVDSSTLAKTPHEFPVVAVGASAGGLEAFTELLQHLPVNTGTAFVFIQHLAPDHTSMLTHLLSRETSMAVVQAQDGAAIEPDHVYVIPPNAAMTISGLNLALRPRDSAGSAVDVFLRSLARNRLGGAVAVILSGTGSDGMLGVQAIAEEGGLVMAQDPKSARFDGMPNSAIATGCVDFVLTPKAIAAELAKISREPGVLHSNLLETSRQDPASEESFQSILDLLRIETGIDFGNYRQSTVRRRVTRRLSFLKLGNLSGYLDHAKDNPAELHILAQDILIRVTRFFRDPETFDILSHRVFPGLIRNALPDRPVRIWAAGCSTGEEAYSIAICFVEVAEQMQSRVPVQVFATDINEAAIARARRGAYVENIVADVTQARLARFFVRTGKELYISRRIREMCVFSQHDLLSDPPFSRMDLVSCRNVLIYLDSMQKQALSRIHFALNPGGILLLGKSESTAPTPGLFAPIDKSARLYVQQDAILSPARTREGNRDIVSPRVRSGSSWARLRLSLDVSGHAHRVLAARYSPPYAIVNANLEAQESRDAAGILPAGRQRHDLLDAAVRDHADALRAAVHRADAEGQPARLERVTLGDSFPREFTIDVTPIGSDRKHYLLVFEDRTGELEPDAGPAATGGNAISSQLESLIVDQQAANDEILASNEELQSLNEELESSKEELEGSKEEIEAANEELITVNRELNIRNTELESAREFAQATIDAVRSSLVVLGPDLRVLKANQSFYRTFRLSQGEVENRFIYELGGGHWKNPRLRILLEEIVPASLVCDDYEMDLDLPSGGRWSLVLNARRFAGEDRLLLAIEDVTVTKRAGEEAERQSQKMESIGYLAAGVAHDFNNMLTGILGNASIVLRATPENAPTRLPIEDVVNGAKRAADLTRQLLAYGGKGRVYLEQVNLSDVVIQTSRLLQASIPANVQLQLDLDRHPPTLLADPGQLQQVVMNLLINGVEAIGKTPGTVIVRTGRQAVTTEALPDLYPSERLPPGDYATLEVQDNGSGMEQRVVHKIFDPFFTTKITGRGLGLAALLGVVRQHKGAVQVISTPGQGSSMRVLLPAAVTAEQRVVVSEAFEARRGTATVLVVEDEEMIRTLTRSALEPFGYKVLLAHDGQEGVRTFQENSRQIGVVLLDVGMPGLDGLATLKWIRVIRPDVPAIICSGFGDADVEERFAEMAPVEFLPKPYTVDQLLEKIQKWTPPVAS